MQRIRKSKIAAGLLSLFMLLQVLLMPVANAASTDAGPSNAQVIVKVERKGNDAKDEKKTRKLRLYKISEKELSQDELKEQYDKFNGKSQAEVEKALTQSGTLIHADTDDEKTEVKKEEITPESKEFETIIKEIDGKSYDYYEFKDLADGAYLLIETDESAKDHQYKLVCSTFNIGENAILNQELLPKVDEQKAKPLKLHKIGYKDDKSESTPLEGVVFNLIDDKGEVVKLSKEGEGVYKLDNDNGIADITTNKNGDIIINGLADGQYKFKEIKTIENYVIDEKVREKSVNYQRLQDNSIEFTNKTPDVTKEIINLTKKDGDTGKALDGVEFRLYVKSGDTLTPVGENEKGELAAFKNADKVFKTNSNGKLEIKNLPKLPDSQKYVFIEIKSQEGYQITPDKIYEVGKDGSVNVGNYKRPVDIKLNKYDIDTDDPIDKVGFELYRIKTEKANDGTIKVIKDKTFGVYGKNGTYEYKAGSEESTQTYELYTDSKGNISVTGLPAGDYYLKETKPQKNYDSDENRGKMTDYLSHEKSAYSQSNKSLLPPPVTPPKKGDEKTGSFKFMKVDDSKEKNRLEGATFAVYKVDEKGQAEPYEVDNKRLTVKSGKNGEFKVENLPYGKYQLRETAAPSGYILDTSPIAFEITETSETSKTIMIINKKNPDKSLVPPTITPPGTKTPSGSTTPPGTTTRVPSTVNPPKTYYVPQDKPGIPRGPLVKTGDIRIIVFVAIGLVMIIAGKSIVSKEEKMQLKSISAR